MSLEPRGKFEIGRLGQVFRVRLWDFWDLDGVLTFFEAYKRAILEAGIRRFGVLTDMRNHAGATPEALEKFQSVIAWAAEKGQVCRAVLVNSTERGLLNQKAVAGLGRVPTKEFESESAALTWLASQDLQIEGVVL